MEEGSPGWVERGSSAGRAALAGESKFGSWAAEVSQLPASGAAPAEASTWAMASPAFSSVHSASPVGAPQDWSACFGWSLLFGGVNDVFDMVIVGVN